MDVSKFLIQPNKDIQPNNSHENVENQEVFIDQSFQIFNSKIEWEKMEWRIGLMMPQDEWKDKIVGTIDWDTLDRRYAKLFGGKVSTSGLNFFIYNVDGVAYADFVQALVRVDEQNAVYIFINACPIDKLPPYVDLFNIEYKGKPVVAFDLTHQSLLSEINIQTKNEEEIQQIINSKLQITELMKKIMSGEIKEFAK